MNDSLSYEIRQSTIHIMDFKTILAMIGSGVSYTLQDYSHIASITVASLTGCLVMIRIIGECKRQYRSWRANTKKK